MIDVSEKSFLGAAKGKIITGFVLAFFALFLAWGVSKIAFNEMLDTVDTISTPNAKLRLVNQVSRKVASLDQQQRTTAFNSPGKYNGFLKDSRQLRILLDSLGGMYLNDPLQLNRIRSIEKLLVARDKQFVNYLKVREGLVNNKSFTDEVQKLNEMVNRPPQQQDSTIVTTEKKTSTVTILPVDESKRKGFLSRIFSKKNESPEQNKSYQVTNEEKIKRDTIALSGETIIAKGLEKSLRSIASEQRLRSARFLDREAVLANANNALTRQMLDILRKVESEVVAQIEQNGIQAKAVVNTGITRISWIMIGFFLLTIILLYLILTDITRSNLYRKELEAARDEAEYHGMAKQRFLSNMSHEIRTPLQSIIGYAEIIRNQEHPQHKDIEAIYHSSEHLLQIVNEILDYNRIISGKFTFQRKPFNIKDLLEEVVSVMKPQAEQKQLIMRTAIELQGIEFIEGDAFRLKQILYNLMSNAVKFTQKGEVVLTVYYKRQLGNLHFTFMVKDTGIGFTEEESHRIFNEFEQIDSADKEVINKAGAGLGLTIIKSLVENQDGRIYVKSKAGAGSTFTVYLTFKVADALQVEKVLPLPAKKLNTTDKVWVVDDDQLILDLCEIIFSKKKIPYLCFNSPAAVLAAEWDPAVKYMLMDMRMPEISGTELCHLMRDRIPADVKIYAMTAQVLPEELEAVLGQGFDGLIMKPFRENDLLAVFSTDDDLPEAVGSFVDSRIAASGDTEGGLRSADELFAESRMQALVPQEAAVKKDEEAQAATSPEELTSPEEEQVHPAALHFDQSQTAGQITSAAKNNPTKTGSPINAGEKSSTEEMTAESDIALDTSIVEKMTFGDQELLVNILNRFKEDCEHDVEELEQGILLNDLPLSRLIVHRIAGRTAQMGSAKLAAEFRLMEIELAASEEITDSHREKLKSCMSRLGQLMQLVDLKIG